jgi:hypothetical protein
MNPAPLRADCARCAALCCVALAFDRSALFAFDKAAGEPCPNLETCGRCRIYADREREGFGGCVRYDCLGAGQRVIQEVFAGRTWRDEPALLAPMLRAFATLREAHELLLLLNEAGKLALTRDERDSLTDLEGALQPRDGWSVYSLSRLRLSEISRRARRFLGGLRGRIPHAAARA